MAALVEQSESLHSMMAKMSTYPTISSQLVRMEQESIVCSGRVSVMRLGGQASIGSAARKSKVLSVEKLEEQLKQLDLGTAEPCQAVAMLWPCSIAGYLVQHSSVKGEAVVVP